MYRLIATLLLCCTTALLGQTAVSLSITGSATLSGTSAYSLSGTALVSGLGNGNASFSGGGPISATAAPGAATGPLLGNFSIVFPSDGSVLYGTYAIPQGIFIPQLGGSASGSGSMTIQGGTGRFDGARGTIGNIVGSGTVNGQANSSFSVSGSGTVTVGQKILSQFVFGGGWYTALYFTNTTPAALSFTLTTTADNGSPLSVPGFPSNVTLAAGGSVRLEAANSGDLSSGYVTVTPPTGVTGYAIFRQSVAGTPDQEAVVPLSPVGAATSSLTFDDTNYTTAVAIVNPTTTTATVSIAAKNAAGASLGTATVTLNANNKTALVLRSITGLSAVAGNVGTVTFTVTSGSVAVLGLRFNGSAFTSIPASN